MNNKPLVAGSLTRRLLATLIDIFLIGLFQMATTYFLRAPLSRFTPVYPWFSIVIDILLWSLFFGVSKEGLTPGGYVADVQVITADGLPLTWSKAILRGACCAIWNSAFKVPSALALINPIFGTPMTTLLASTIWNSIFWSFFFITSFDPLKRSFFDLLSGTRVIRLAPPDQDIVLSQTEKSPRFLGGIYIGLTLFVFAGLYIAHQAQLHGLSEDTVQLTGLLRWMRAHSPLEAPQAQVRYVWRNGMIQSQKVPTLVVRGWTSAELLDSAKPRDLEIARLQKDFATVPELGKGFLQLEVDIYTLPIGSRFSFRPFIPYYIPLDADTQATQFYASHPQVALSTNTVLDYYHVEDRVPANWANRLYGQRMWNEVAATIQKHLNRRNELEGKMAFLLVDQLALMSDPKEYRSRKKILDEWIQQDPNNAFAYLIRGRLSRHYAWTLRGGSFAMYVDKTQWAPFQDLMEAAKHDYEKAAALDPSNPMPWSELIEIARTLDLGADNARSYFNEAIRRAPWYDSARHTYMFGLTPQWGGSLDKMRSFAAECEKVATQYPLAGLNELLPIQIEAGGSRDSADVYKRDDSWSTIQQVFERVFAHYPDQGYYHAQYAWYAWMAEKWELAADQMDIVGDHFYKGTNWTNLSDYNVNRAYCYKQKAWKAMTQNQIDTEIGWLQKSLRYGPFDSWPMSEMAQCYQKKNDPANAKIWAEKTLSNQPRDDDRQMAENVLKWATAKGS